MSRLFGLDHLIFWKDWCNRIDNKTNPFRVSIENLMVQPIKFKKENRITN